MAITFEKTQALLLQQQAQFEKYRGNVPLPETLTQHINQDPDNQGNGNQNDGQNDSNGSQDKASKTAEAMLADNDADEYEEYYSYEKGHVGAHQETSSKLEKLNVDAEDLPSSAETQDSDRISVEEPINRRR
ncbi:hypothetical protein X801_08094 [Opisthorchis viverrini]|uniref:Uncharacterized protein n=1 Tax=Opisthorchis viverrini TaxID=6198 RepID=A0A1S8WNR1_OPIVI|nr:hypothetical protein X801_08094 [Opisthorchis viverrini]